MKKKIFNSLVCVLSSSIVLAATLALPRGWFTIS